MIVNRFGSPHSRLALVRAFFCLGCLLNNSCVARAPQFATAGSLFDPKAEESSLFVPPALATQAAPTWGVRQVVVDSLFLGLNLNDRTTVVAQLTSDCELRHPSKSPIVSSGAIWSALESQSVELTAKTRQSHYLLDHTIVGSQSLSDRVLVEVQGGPTFDGQWTLVFSNEHVGKIREILLPHND